VTRIALGVVSLVAELRGHERQAARELDQWNTSHEEPEPLDGSPAARALELERQADEVHGMLRRSGAGARDQPDGGGPHPPRGERPGVEPGCASTCRPTFPIKLERTSRGGTEARLADTSSGHTRSRTAARRCRATRCRRRCADRASRGARLFHPHPSSEPK